MSNEMTEGMLALESMALEMPEVENHPNRREFHGVLTTVDVASDRPPSGSRGHRVMLTSASVEAALPTLLGMAIDYTPEMDGHDARRKVGVISDAELKARVGGGKQIDIRGFLYERDFPEVAAAMSKEGKTRLGMSYEIANVRVVDTSAEVWTVRQFDFTGAAVLRRSKAAYGETWVELSER